jgi:hypothetical protein
MPLNQEAMKNLDKGDQFFWSIGRFISAFSNLEFDIKCYISFAINLPEEYFDQVLSHDFAMLCTMAQSVLCRGADENRTAQLKTLISRCRKLNDHRVRIVHGWWHIGHRSGSLQHVSRQRLESSKYYMDAREIAGLADEANNLSIDLWQWASKNQKLPQSK